MTRVRIWVVAAAVGATGILACQKPTVCPQGFREKVADEQAVWCRQAGGKQELYYQLHPTNRRKRQSCPFVAGVLEGPFEAWHPDGKNWLVGRYDTGKPAGKWQQWSETGSKVAEGQYRDGQLINGAPVAMAAICGNIRR
jgi:hypothetical protein